MGTKKSVPVVRPLITENDTDKDYLRDVVNSHVLGQQAYQNTVVNGQDNGSALKPGGDTVGNGVLGTFKDSVDKALYDVVGGVARFGANQIDPGARDGILNGIADWAEERSAYNTEDPQQLTGAKWWANAVGNAIGSSAPTAIIFAAMSALGPAAGGLSALAGGVANGARLANLISKGKTLGTFAQAAKAGANLVSKGAGAVASGDRALREAALIRKFWTSPFGKFAIADQLGNIPESMSEAGNLITQLRQDPENYTDEEIATAAWKSFGGNMAWLTATDALQAHVLGKMLGKPVQEATTETFGKMLSQKGIEFSKEGLKQLGKQTAKVSAANAFQEGLEEFGQGYIENKAAGQDFNVEEAIEAAKMGAAGGMFLGAGGNVLNARMDNSKKIRLNGRLYEISNPDSEGRVHTKIDGQEVSHSEFFNKVGGMVEGGLTARNFGDNGFVDPRDIKTVRDVDNYIADMNERMNYYGGLGTFENAGIISDYIRQAENVTGDSKVAIGRKLVEATNNSIRDVIVRHKAKVQAENQAKVQEDIAKNAQTQREEVVAAEQKNTASTVSNLETAQNINDTNTKILFGPGAVGAAATTAQVQNATDAANKILSDVANSNKRVQNNTSNNVRVAMDKTGKSVFGLVQGINSHPQDFKSIDELDNVLESGRNIFDPQDLNGKEQYDRTTFTNTDGMIDAYSHGAQRSWEHNAKAAKTQEELDTAKKKFDERMSRLEKAGADKLDGKKHLAQKKAAQEMYAQLSEGIKNPDTSLIRDAVDKMVAASKKGLKNLKQSKANLLRSKKNQSPAVQKAINDKFTELEKELTKNETKDNKPIQGSDTLSKQAEPKEDGDKGASKENKGSDNTEGKVKRDENTPRKMVGDNIRVALDVAKYHIDDVLKGLKSHKRDIKVNENVKVDKGGNEVSTNIEETADVKTIDSLVSEFQKVYKEYDNMPAEKLSDAAREKTLKHLWDLVSKMGDTNDKIRYAAKAAEISRRWQTAKQSVERIAEAVENLRNAKGSIDGLRKEISKVLGEDITDGTTNLTNEEKDNIIASWKEKVKAVGIDMCSTPEEFLAKKADIIEDTKDSKLYKVTDIENSNGRIYIHYEENGVAKQDEITQDMGWTLPGSKVIYINKNTMDASTPIHEYVHVWAYVIKQNNPELWNKIKDVMKRTGMYDLVQEVGQYGKLSEDVVVEEALAFTTGYHWATIEKAINDKEKSSLWLRAVKGFWNAVKELLGFSTNRKNAVDNDVFDLMQMPIASLLNKDTGVGISEREAMQQTADIAARLSFGEIKADEAYESVEKIKENMVKAGLADPALITKLQKKMYAQLQTAQILAQEADDITESYIEPVIDALVKAESILATNTSTTLEKFVPEKIYANNKKKSIGLKRADKVGWYSANNAFADLFKDGILNRKKLATYRGDVFDNVQNSPYFNKLWGILASRAIDKFEAALNNHKQGEEFKKSSATHAKTDILNRMQLIKTQAKRTFDKGYMPPRNNRVAQKKASGSYVMPSSVIREKVGAEDFNKLFAEDITQEEFNKIFDKVEDKGDKPKLMSARKQGSLATSKEHFGGVDVAADTLLQVEDEYGDGNLDVADLMNGKMTVKGSKFIEHTVRVPNLSTTYKISNAMRLYSRAIYRGATFIAQNPTATPGMMKEYIESDNFEYGDSVMEVALSLRNLPTISNLDNARLQDFALFLGNVIAKCEKHFSGVEMYLGDVEPTVREYLFGNVGTQKRDIIATIKGTTGGENFNFYGINNEPIGVVVDGKKFYPLERQNVFSNGEAITTSKVEKPMFGELANQSYNGYSLKQAIAPAWNGLSEEDKIQMLDDTVKAVANVLVFNDLNVDSRMFEKENFDLFAKKDTGAIDKLPKRIEECVKYIKTGNVEASNPLEQAQKQADLDRLIDALKRAKLLSEDNKKIKSGWGQSVDEVAQDFDIQLDDVIKTSLQKDGYIDGLVNALNDLREGNFAAADIDWNNEVYDRQEQDAADQDLQDTNDELRRIQEEDDAEEATYYEDDAEGQDDTGVEEEGTRSKSFRNDELESEQGDEEVVEKSIAKQEKVLPVEDDAKTSLIKSILDLEVAFMYRLTLTDKTPRLDAAKMIRGLLMKKTNEYTQTWSNAQEAGKLIQAEAANFEKAKAEIEKNISSQISVVMRNAPNRREFRPSWFARLLAGRATGYTVDGTHVVFRGPQLRNDEVKTIDDRVKSVLEDVGVRVIQDNLSEKLAKTNIDNTVKKWADSLGDAEAITKAKALADVSENHKANRTSLINAIVQAQDNIMEFATHNERCYTKVYKNQDDSYSTEWREVEPQLYSLAKYVYEKKTGKKVKVQERFLKDNAVTKIALTYGCSEEVAKLAYNIALNEHLPRPYRLTIKGVDKETLPQANNIADSIYNNIPRNYAEQNRSFEELRSLANNNLEAMAATLLMNRMKRAETTANFAIKSVRARLNAIENKLVHAQIEHDAFTTWALYLNDLRTDNTGTQESVVNIQKAVDNLRSKYKEDENAFTALTEEIFGVNIRNILTEQLGIYNQGEGPVSSNRDAGHNNQAVDEQRHVSTVMRERLAGSISVPGRRTVDGRAQGSNQAGISGQSNIQPSTRLEPARGVEARSTNLVGGKTDYRWRKRNVNGSVEGGKGNEGQGTRIRPLEGSTNNRREGVGGPQANRNLYAQVSREEGLEGTSHILSVLDYINGLYVADDKKRSRDNKNANDEYFSARKILVVTSSPEESQRWSQLAQQRYGNAINEYGNDFDGVGVATITFDALSKENGGNEKWDNVVVADPNFINNAEYYDKVSRLVGYIQDDGLDTYAELSRYVAEQGDKILTTAMGKDYLNTMVELERYLKTVEDRVKSDKTVLDDVTYDNEVGQKLRQTLQNINKVEVSDKARKTIHGLFISHYLAKVKEGRKNAWNISNALHTERIFVSMAEPMKETGEINNTVATPNGFRGEFSYLSNMHPSPITIDGKTYNSVENYFQAMKSTDTNTQQKIATASPVNARKFGRQIELREDWDNIKDDVMENAVKAKFQQHPELMSKLNTVQGEIVEYNDWGDRYWGKDKVTQIGDNKLGKILMSIRGDNRTVVDSLKQTKWENVNDISAGHIQTTNAMTLKNNPKSFENKVVVDITRGKGPTRAYPKAVDGSKYAPSQKVLDDWKNSKQDQAAIDAYIGSYVAEQNAAYEQDNTHYDLINKQDKDVVLACYERVNEFCHRHILKALAEAANNNNGEKVVSFEGVDTSGVSVQQAWEDLQKRNAAMKKVVNNPANYYEKLPYEIPYHTPAFVKGLDDVVTLYTKIGKAQKALDDNTDKRSQQEKQEALATLQNKLVDLLNSVDKAERSLMLDRLANSLGVEADKNIPRRMSFGKSLDDIGDRAKKFVQHPVDTFNEWAVGKPDNGKDVTFLENELDDARYKYERAVRGIANEHDRQFITIIKTETDPETGRKIKVAEKEIERPEYTALKKAEEAHLKALSERMPSFSFFRSVHNLAKENPFINKLYTIFTGAGTKQEQLRNRFANKWNEILDLLETQEQIDSFSNILFMGSVEGKYYTRTELLEDDVDSNVIEAVQRVRAMNDSLYMLQNRAFRGLIPGKNMFVRVRMGVYGYDQKRNEPAVYDYIQGQNGADVDRRMNKSVLQTIVEDKFNEDVFITLFKAADNTYYKTKDEAVAHNQQNGMDSETAKANVVTEDLSPRDFLGHNHIVQNMENGNLTVTLWKKNENGSVSSLIGTELQLSPSEDVLISYNKPQVHHGHSESMIVGSEEWEKFKSDPHNYIYGTHDENGNIIESDLRIIYRDNMFNPQTGEYGLTPVYSIVYDYVKPNFPYRKGYLPHFFGGYGVYGIISEPRPDGSFRERIAILASDDDVQVAIQKAEEIKKNGITFVDKKFDENGVDRSVTRFLAPNGKIGNKKKQDGQEGIIEVFVKPKDFDMQSDKNLDECNLDEWEFKKTVDAAAQISGGDFNALQERLKPILQSKKLHHRFNSHEYKQTGAWGWNLNVFDIMPKYINQATRYAAMEPAKFEAISEFEKMFGEGSFEKEAPVSAPLRRWAKRYIQYNNGTPMELERKLNQFIADNEWLSKFFAKHCNANYRDRIPLLIGTKINSIVAPAMLGCFSISSALVNMTQLKNAYVKIGYKGLEKGFAAVKYMKTQQLKISNLEKSIKDKRKEYSKLMREYNNLQHAILQYQGGLMSSASFSKYKEWQNRLPTIQKELDRVKKSIQPTLNEISKLKSDKQYLDYLRILHETGTDTRIGLSSPSTFTKGWTAKKKLQNKQLDWDAVRYYLRKASDKGMVFFQGTEEMTRSIATLGAYLQARETPEIMGRPDFIRKSAVDFARSVDIFANFDYGAADAPGLFSLFSGTGFGEVATLFQKYPIKESEIMMQALPMFGSKTMTTSEKIRYWSTYMMLCGMFAFPLFDWLEDLINEISGVRVFSRAKARILETFGENPFTYAICYGIPGAFGTDISRRVSLANMTPDHDSLWGYITGVPGSAALNIANSLVNGDGIGAIKSYTPALGHAMEAYYGARYNRKGRMAYRYNNTERAWKFFGFRPTGESVQRDVQAEERNQTNRKQIERQSLKTYLAKKFSAGDQITESDRQEMRNLKLKWKDVVEEYKKQLHTKMELKKKNRRV